ncbi:MAG: NADP-dependent oxidoreductase [Alicyclobacillaceae bacterium]|uniref:NADP-dependent oxidoreductase n=1 Tax=Alicyclobacillus sp. SP_1 TaxID=2942475 RepID=UPI0021570CB2|nr:NADP-dependent oxidoreductase [Alicyclobacillus sp. SP_1]MCY0888576.1 NADP-dependent oxidoreductase [Alicyclobacillaceae bacterium]
MPNNVQIRLASRPKGMPTEETFSVVEAQVPTPGPGEVLVKTLYLSVDPYMRGRMSDAKSYVPPFVVGDVLTGGVVGQVVESHNDKFHVGEFVLGELGWQHYNLSSGRLTKLNADLAPLTAYLGVLGMPGMTAYFGLLDIGRPKAGETVVVSGAAGAVGSLVGQIAKLKGCRVVGIAGSDDKNRYLESELGFDATINYKTVDSLRKAVAAACPEGVDVYFDNVGGDITDAVFLHLNDFSRVALCGQIAGYNAEKVEMGPRLLSQLLIHRVLLKGFIVSDYHADYGKAAVEMAGWLKEGKLKYKETIVDGLEHAPQAFLGLFRGDNIGKQLVRVAMPE